MQSGRRTSRRTLLASALWGFGYTFTSGAMDAWVARRLAETGLPDPSVDQADALRTWQPRFVAGRRS